MSIDRDLTDLVRSWLKTDEHESADRVLGAVFDRLESTPQRLSAWEAWRKNLMSGTLKFLAAGTAIVLVVAIALGIYLSRPAVGPAASPSPAVSPPATSGTSSAPSTPSQVASSTSTAPATISLLPVLQLPGTRGGDPGTYGWQGKSGGSREGMHWVVDGSREVAAMFFDVGPDCFTENEDPSPTSVSIAGYAGELVEPYEPAAVFNAVGDEITRAYALDVEGRTLCVYLTWHPTTTEAELKSAAEILDTIRAQPIGEDEVRITFYLRDRWDTG